MFRLIHPLGGMGLGSRAGGGAAAASFDPSSVAGYSRDWNFADITKLYTDTAGTVAVTADGDPIGAILDTAGSGVKLAAPADASRPTYETAIQNGLSVARFDGSDDYLTHATAITADATQTFYIVLQKRSAPAAVHRDMFSLSNNAALRTDTDVGAGYVYYLNAAAGLTSVGGTPTNWSIVTLKYASVSSLLVYVNGGAPTTLDPHDGYSVVTALTLGASAAGTSDADFDFGRVLVYSAAHTTTEMDAVLSGLGTLWGISVTPTS